ncbi:MAG: hypothetical protein ACLFPR_11340, partial [Desulfococcaceae bacterium]
MAPAAGEREWPIRKAFSRSGHGHELVSGHEKNQLGGVGVGKQTVKIVGAIRRNVGRIHGISSKAWAGSSRQRSLGTGHRVSKPA